MCHTACMLLGHVWCMFDNMQFVLDPINSGYRPTRCRIACKAIRRPPIASSFFTCSNCARRWGVGGPQRLRGQPPEWAWKALLDSMRFAIGVCLKDVERCGRLRCRLNKKLGCSSSIHITAELSDGTRTIVLQTLPA